MYIEMFPETITGELSKIRIILLVITSFVFMVFLHTLELTPLILLSLDPLLSIMKLNPRIWQEAMTWMRTGVEPLLLAEIAKPIMMAVIVRR